MQLTKKPVEHLVFMIENPQDVTRFIEYDNEIWTAFLSKKKGYVSKEIWINEDTPGEIHTILVWETLENWKSIPLEQLMAKNHEFESAFNRPFQLVRRIHEEKNYGIFRVYQS